MASYLHRTATTLYLCCVPTLEDSKGAGRVGLAECKGTKKFITSNSYHEFFLYFYANFFSESILSFLYTYKVLKINCLIKKCFYDNQSNFYHD